MPLQTGQVLALFDARNRPVGHLRLERVEGDLLVGQFQVGPAFPDVAPLFQDFEEAVNQQALSVVDQLDTAIAALGLYLSPTDDSRQWEVFDVQIWSDGGMSCRLRGSGQESSNGSPGATHCGQVVRE